MSEKIKITMSVTTTGPGLTLAVAVDGHVIWQGDPSTVTEIAGECDDTEGQAHVLTLALQGKSPEHTVLDQSGSIVSDRVVTISGLRMDDIDIDKILWETSVYEHDFNGTGDRIQDRFFGTMGCNGTVSMCFSSPFYLWLLENM